MRPRNDRFLNPAGLRGAQYRVFLDALEELAPDLVENFWNTCWPSVRDAPPERRMIEPVNAADRWLRANRLVGPDGSPPAWLKDSLAMELIGRAEVVRLYGDDPGQQPFGAVGHAVVENSVTVLPSARRLEFRCVLEPARGLRQERMRILKEFEKWIDAQMAAIETGGLVEALGEAAESQAIRLWIEEWMKRAHGRDVEAAVVVDERHRRRLVQWAGETLELALPRRRR